MEHDFVHLDLFAFVNVDAEFGPVGKQRVRLLLHRDVDVQKALVHVVVADALGGHRQHVVVQDAARQQVDLALHRFLLGAVHPGDAVPGQTWEFLHPNDQIDVPVAHFGHFNLDVGEQVLGPQSRDRPADGVPGDFDLLPHLKRTEELDGLDICVLGPEHRQPRNFVGAGQLQVNEVLLPLHQVGQRRPCGHATCANDAQQPHSHTIHQVWGKLGTAPKRRSRF